jgi:hypothetical protein
MQNLTNTPFHDESHAAKPVASSLQNRSRNLEAAININSRMKYTQTHDSTAISTYATIGSVILRFLNALLKLIVTRNA